MYTSELILKLSQIYLETLQDEVDEETWATDRETARPYIEGFASWLAVADRTMLLLAY
jgi:hypothetical protein